MPYELVWEPRCLVRRYVGHVTGADVVASLREVSADLRFDDIRGCVADYSAVQSMAVDEDAAALIAALHIGLSYSNPGLHTACVAVDHAVIGEVTRLVRMVRPASRLVVHPSADAARRWIRDRGSLDWGAN